MSIIFGYIDAVVTEDTVTVFWDQPEPKPLDPHYRVTLVEAGTASSPATQSDARIVETTVTHHGFDDLEPSTTYMLTVELLDEITAQTVMASTSISVTTTGRKALLDVTLPPYNAVGDGVADDTAAIQRAINDCAADQAVYLPQGTFLTGALFLHSDMELRVNTGATLQGSNDPAKYLPKIPSRFEGIERECYASLLNFGTLDHAAGYNCANVTLRGGGTIFGGGLALAQATIDVEREHLADELAALGDGIKEYENANTIPGRARGRLMQIANSRNILMENLTLGYGPAWNIHFIYSDRIITHDCVVESLGVWNGDGWDPDSSTNSAIFGCEFRTGDDMVAVKSGKNPEGNVIGHPTEHIRVFDCTGDGGHGIAIGSEMSGGVDDVKIWDCDMRKSACGLEIKSTAKRGGYVRNVELSRCAVSRVLVHRAVGYNDDGEAAPNTPVYENIRFENIHATGRRWHDGGWATCPPVEITTPGDSHESLRNVTMDGVVFGA